MFAIETELGRFEGENEKEAKAKLAKAKKDHAKQERINEERRNVARLRAESRGFYLLSRLVKGEDFPRPWEFCKPGTPCGPKLETGAYDQTAVYETPQGHVTYRHVGYRVLGCLCDGAGYTAAVFTHEIDRPETVYCLAVGAEEGIAYFVDVPGVTPEMFVREETAVA